MNLSHNEMNTILYSLTSTYEFLKEDSELGDDASYMCDEGYVSLLNQITSLKDRMVEESGISY